MTDIAGEDGAYHHSKSKGQHSTSNHRIRDTNVFKLYVSRIPSEMQTDEFKNVFAEVAEPHGVHLSTPSSTAKFKWGFVEYASFCDAEAAIHKLHEKPPHEFNIKYANSDDKSKRANSQNCYKSERSREYNNNRRSGRYSHGSQMAEDSSSSDVNDFVDKHPPRRDTHHHRSKVSLPNGIVKNIHIVSENGHRAVKAEFEGNGLPDSKHNDSGSIYNFTSLLVALDNCHVCKSDALKKCPYCGTPYCSDSCAAKDWENHKSRCIRSNEACATSTPRDRGDSQYTRPNKKENSPHHPTTPVNSSFRFVNSSRSRDSNHLGGGNQRSRMSFSEESCLRQQEKAVVMNVEEDGIVWVVSDKENAFSIHAQLQEFCTSSKAKRVDRPTPGMRCSAFSNEEKEWYRAEIISVKPSLRVRYMDYGNEEDISIDQLRTLSSELSSISALAFKIKLSPESSSLSKKLNITTVLMLKPIKVIGDALLVNAEIVSTGTAESPAYNLPPTDNPPIPKNVFTKVMISYSAERNVYWAQKFSDNDKCLQLLKEVNSFCKTSPPAKSSDIQVGTICGALFENLWYRGEVLAVKPAIKVRLIDYGNEEICKSDEIRTLKQDLISLPCYAFKIELAPGTSDKYLGLLEDTVLSVKPVSMVGDSWLAHVENDNYSEPAETSSASKSKESVEKSTPNAVPSSTKTYDKKPVCQQKDTVDKLAPEPPIPNDVFTTVVVSVPVDSVTYWVFEFANAAQIDNILLVLNKFCTTSDAKRFTYTPNVGTLCAAMFEGDWYRGLIMTVKPEIVVRFIDYGNEEACSLDFIRTLPNELLSIPPLAFKIKLADKTSSKYHNLPACLSKLAVMPVNMVDGIWTVHVENEIYDDAIVEYRMSDNHSSSSSNISISPSTSKKKTSSPVSVNGTDSEPSSNVINKESPIPHGHFSQVVVSYMLKPEVYWVYKLSDLNKVDVLLNKMNSYCNSSLATVIPTPAVGTICSAFFEGDWYRAKIIAMKPEPKVLFIDFGNEEVYASNVLKNISPELSSLPELAFKIKLAEGTSEKYLNLLQGDNLSICPVSQYDNTWTVHVENEKYDSPPKTDTIKNDTMNKTARCEDVMSQSVKTVKDPSKSSLKPLPEDSFTKVLITSPVDDSTYWVNKLADINILTKILLDIATYCSSSQAERITNPIVGSLYSALFEEEWNRATVLAVKPALLVKFIDFGNDGICSLNDIRTLPPELTSIPPLAFQIRLADGTPRKYCNLPFNSELSVKPVSSADDVWSVHIENEIYLNTSPLSSSLNIKKAVITNGFSPNDISSIVKKEVPDMKTTTPERTSPQVGIKKATPDKIDGPISRDEFTEVIVMVPINETSYWVVPNEKMAKSNAILSDLASCSLKSITDVESGMKCAAKYDDTWYRARVLSINPLQVKFVDFGNVEDVSPSDIRILPHELTKIKPLAFMIKIADGTPDKYKGLEAYSKLSVKLESRDIDKGWVVSVPETKKLTPVKDKDSPFSDHKISFKSKSMYDAESSQPTVKPVVNVKTVEDSDESSLPFNTFSKVKIWICNGPDDYWVYLNSSLKTLMNMTDKLGTLSQEKVLPIIGKTYVRFYEDSWCRAKVKNLKPLTIFYVDYGNDEIVDASDLHPLPPEFINTPPFAFRIKMAEGTSEKYHNINDLATVLSIKPISKTHSGYYLVHVEGEKYPEISTNSTSRSPTKLSTLRSSSDSSRDLAEDEPAKHMLDAAVKLDRCDLIVNKVHSNVHMSCSIMVPGQYSNHLEQINQRIRSLKLSPDYSAKVGSMVGCIDENGLYGRGYLMSVRSSHQLPQVALIDYAFTSEVHSLCPLPISLEELPPSSVTCRFSVPQNDIEVSSILKCSKLVVKGDSVECEVYSRGKCSLSVWKPAIENSPLQNVNVPSGSTVIISSVAEMCSIVYIQSVTQENLNGLKQIVSQTAAHARNESEPTREPEVGEIIACLFNEDNNYYRAQILKIKNKKYSVHFLDFGNNCEATLKDIRYLSDSIKKAPCFSLKVGLEGVKHCAMLPEVQTALEDHISFQTNFTIEYESLSMVKLESQGISLSSKLNQIIDSNLKISGSASSSASRITLDQVKYSDWQVGAKLDLVILCQLSHNMLIVLHNKDPNLTGINDQFTEKLSNYARTNFQPDFTYKPEINEVIIARYEVDGLWYRAQCVKETNGCFEVLFLDFGNTARIKESDSRPISMQFLEVPVISKKCKIHGVPDEVSSEARTALEGFFQEGSLHEVIVTEELSQGGVMVYHPQLVTKVKEKVIPLAPISLPNKI